MTKTKKAIKKEIKDLGLSDYTKQARLWRQFISLNLFLLLVAGIVFGGLIGAYQNSGDNKKVFAEEIENIQNQESEKVGE